LHKHQGNKNAALSPVLCGSYVNTIFIPL